VGTNVSERSHTLLKDQLLPINKLRNLHKVEIIEVLPVNCNRAERGYTAPETWGTAQSDLLGDLTLQTFLILNNN
jgi:hypothetical protein